MHSDITGMVRRDDHDTSVLAAQAVADKLSDLQSVVLEAFRTFGPMTDATLEGLLMFRGNFAYSTVRKRRTDLFQKGLLVEVGRQKNSRGRLMKVWAIPGNVS